ncbi:MAG: hypothetical protein ACJART_001391 [Maribacter sp.]
MKKRASNTNLKTPLKMKKQKTLLASLALGIFLIALAAPIISVDNQELGIDKRQITKRI